MNRAHAKLLKIVSGGQTGVDRAALDAARAAGFAIGGWCPKGRLALDGRIPDHYPMLETPSSLYAQRTEWNVRDSDATLILMFGELRGGTRLTADLAVRYGRPLYIADLRYPPLSSKVLRWLESNAVTVLNVAGPREEGGRGIQRQAEHYVLELLLALKDTSNPVDPAIPHEEDG